MNGIDYMIVSNPPLKLLVVQRVSLSHSSLKSRSIGARFVPLLNYMQRKGLILWRAMLETKINSTDLKEYQAILLNKHTSAKGIDLIKAAKDVGVRTIYDLDDWILELPSYSVTNLDEDTLANIVQMIRLSDATTVSNLVLKNKLKYLRSDAVVLKNGFDHEEMPIDPSLCQEVAPPRILFSNTDDIKLISHRGAFINQVIQFLELFPEVKLDFWGDHFHELGRIPRVCERGFNPNKAYKECIKEQGYIFAVVPLGGQEDPDSLFFNSCKSCIKYIDYGSLGIPAIYSDTPVYSQVIQNGVNGLLVKNEGLNWLSAMVTMYQSSTLRHNIRLAAHKDCTANHGFTESAHKFLCVVQGH
ncbi:hypothetical protein FERRO_01140 [Ferrovum sp. JA12]|nr:hypothetical protein FERRO_01140 [Ferrovum sp. JA12]